MKLLLIGNGYLGQAITREFRAGGWEIIPVSLSGGDGSLPCDVGDPVLVNTLKKHVFPDVIIHCAASGRGGVDAYQRVYVDGCRHLTEAFPGVPLLFTSSTSVYAQVDGTWVTEQSPTLPDRETGVRLLQAERITIAAGGTVARLSGIYGPGRSVILRKFLAGETVIEEDGRRFLNQIHRDDAARAIFHLIRSDCRGETFNVSDSTPLSQLACHQRLAEIFCKPLPPSGPRDPDRKRGWTHKQVSTEKLRATGWQPRFPAFPDSAITLAGTL